MSKHLIEINFDQLKFNLYELLGVSSDAPQKKIKKSYRKLIIKFHPDKNNVIDEEIYNHLTLANQILTNQELREKYDNWLKSFGQDSLQHDNLKENFEKSLTMIEKDLPSMPSEAKTSYYEKEKKLNEKHGLNLDWEYETTQDRYNRKKKELESTIDFQGEKIKNKKDFNKHFNNFKLDNKNKNIIKSEANSSITEFNGDIIGNEYLSVTNYNLLYSDDNVQSNNYSSLDRAFMLQPKIEFEEVDVGKKMKEYKNMSEDLSCLYKNSKKDNV